MSLSNVPADPIAVTVTFLELRQPPARYTPQPMNRSLALLRAGAIPVHYYRYLMDRVGRKWHWVNILRMPDAELEAYLREPGRDIRVLYLDGSPVGFFDLLAGQEEVDLAYFGMAAEAIGGGLGRWFLGAAVQAAWSYEPGRIIVQTCTLDHPAALPLYQKVGFTPVGQMQSTVVPLSARERADALHGI